MMETEEQAEEPQPQLEKEQQIETRSQRVESTSTTTAEEASLANSKLNHCTLMILHRFHSYSRYQLIASQLKVIRLA